MQINLRLQPISTGGQEPSDVRGDDVRPKEGIQQNGVGLQQPAGGNQDEGLVCVRGGFRDQIPRHIGGEGLHAQREELQNPIPDFPATDSQLPSSEQVRDQHRNLLPSFHSEPVPAWLAGPILYPGVEQQMTILFPFSTPTGLRVHFRFFEQLLCANVLA